MKPNFVFCPHCEARITERRVPHVCGKKTMPLTPARIRSSSVKRFKHQATAALVSNDLDRFAERLLELSLTASDRQWQNALSHMEQKLDALPPKENA